MEKEWVYHTDTWNEYRYTLGERADRMIACIGVNPSTAEPHNLDNTMRSVKRIAAFNGYDGWLMGNIYPQRATNPNDLHHKIDRHAHLTNMKILYQTLCIMNIDTVWLAYGNLIEKRDYLPTCKLELLRELNDLEIKWKVTGSLTKKGHPRHPLYLPKESRLKDLDG